MGIDGQSSAKEKIVPEVVSLDAEKASFPAVRMSMDARATPDASRKSVDVAMRKSVEFGRRSVEMARRSLDVPTGNDFQNSIENAVGVNIFPRQSLDRRNLPSAQDEENRGPRKSVEIPSAAKTPVVSPKAEEAKHPDIPEEGGHRESIDPELIPFLQTEPMKGLTADEAGSRLLKFGRNEIPECKPNPLLKFFMYFVGPIEFLIEAAMILAGALQDWIDFGAIMALLFINAFIGFIEESKAENALDALKQTLALKSRVRRNGEIIEIMSAELVPGDIVIVRLGDIVPADCRLTGIGSGGENMESSELMVDQAALTGESLPVQKRKGDLLYSSSVVKQGQMLALVEKTGLNTFIGRAANLMNMTNEIGHFQKVIKTIGYFLVVVTVATCVLVIIILRAPNREPWKETLEFVLVITISSIPVGLPTVLSVTMAVGAKQLAKKKVIVKRLTAVEEMAGLNTLCSDKTGTLTLNELTLDEPYLANNYTNHDLLKIGFLASEQGANDPIELCVRTASLIECPEMAGQANENGILGGYKVTHFTPFDPVAKRTEATVIDAETGATFKVAKGAPQVIIKLAGDHAEDTDAVIRFAKRGLRALGVARTKDNTDEWVLVGLISLLDPPRPDSAETIREINKLGVDVKMITGDQVIIAKEVAHRLGMQRCILDSGKLIDAQETDEEITRRVIKADGFGHVIPEHKYMVVDLLQKRGRLVGMTGDGVNDAPALKKANVGIAVAGCTDAARSASDIVLLGHGLSTIVDGIKTSRAIFQRMRSYALYRITSTLHFLIFFFISIVAVEWALKTTLVVLICLLNDAATLVISVDNVRISRRPDKWRLGQLMSISFVLALLLTAYSFALYFIAKDVFHESADVIQGIMYLQLSTCPHFMIFGTRLQCMWWKKPPSWFFFVVIIGTQIFAMFITIFGAIVPAAIGWQWGLSIMAISWFYFMFMDMVKVLMYKYWCFKLTAYLWPTPARRRKLARKEAEKHYLHRVLGNWHKARKVWLMCTVVAAFKKANRAELKADALKMADSNWKQELEQNAVSVDQHVVLNVDPK